MKKILYNILFKIANNLADSMYFGYLPDPSKIVYVEKYNIIDALLFLLVTHLMDKLDDCKE